MVRLVIRIQIRHAEPSRPLLNPLKIGTTGLTGEAQPPRQGRGIGRRSPPRAGSTTVDGENGKIIGGKLSFLQAISRNSIPSVTELSNTETFRNLSPSSFLLNSCLAQFLYLFSRFSSHFFLFMESCLRVVAKLPVTRMRSLSFTLMHDYALILASADTTAQRYTQTAGYEDLPPGEHALLSAMLRLC